MRTANHLHRWQSLATRGANVSSREDESLFFIISAQMSNFHIHACNLLVNRDISTILRFNLEFKLMLDTVCVPCSSIRVVFPRHLRSWQPVSRQHRWEEQLNLKGLSVQLKQEILQTSRHLFPQLERDGGSVEKFKSGLMSPVNTNEVQRYITAFVQSCVSRHGWTGKERPNAIEEALYYFTDMYRPLRLLKDHRPSPAHSSSRHF